LANGQVLPAFPRADSRGTLVADSPAMWIVTLMPSFIALGLFLGTLAIRPARR
jgi:hypothetical protein